MKRDADKKRDDDKRRDDDNKRNDDKKSEDEKCGLSWLHVPFFYTDHNGDERANVEQLEADGDHGHGRHVCTFGFRTSMPLSRVLREASDAGCAPFRYKPIGMAIVVQRDGLRSDDDTKSDDDRKPDDDTKRDDRSEGNSDRSNTSSSHYGGDPYFRDQDDDQGKDDDRKKDDDSGKDDDTKKDDAEGKDDDRTLAVYAVPPEILRMSGRDYFLLSGQFGVETMIAHSVSRPSLRFCLK
ncbi:hypothetical protein AK812_SmicGene38496 [Symbiodinium microadriaticum]|uniref:Uncharacterized protein n=1 Tax=Symbiodinium microadriaticum TaxID=2951 RepID=A0A1Q9CDM8_SYMMI|nr:hypothetical protein AK812_SmicGene38496 [Symbiodinium microadriaticum]